MINPKYDSNNYLKHQAIPVITDNHKINQLFESYLLRIKWWYDNAKALPQSNFIGTLRIKITTPLGELEPTDYQIKISSHKQIYVQFLQIPKPDFQYSIEVIHPVGITRSRLEIWEYVKPITTIIKMSDSYVPQFNNNPDMQAGLNAIAAAVTANANTVVSAIQAADLELPMENFQYTRVIDESFSFLTSRIDADQNRESISFSNTGEWSMKVSLAPIAENALYPDVVSFEEPIIPPGGRMSFEGDASKGVFNLISEKETTITVGGSYHIGLGDLPGTTQG